MEMKIQEQILQNLKNLDRIAERPSLYSDTSQLVLGHIPKTAFKCISYFLLKSFLGMNAIEEEDLRNSLARAAYNKGLQGDWIILDELVRLNTSAPLAIVDRLLSYKSTEDFFGNYIYEIRRLNKILVWKYAFEVPKRKKPRRPQRRRGYNDKGTMRPSHVSVKFIEKSDREPFIPITTSSHTWFSKIPFLSDRARTVSAEFDQRNSGNSEIYESYQLEKKRITNSIRRKLNRLKIKKNTGQIGQNEFDYQISMLLLKKYFFLMENRIQLNRDLQKLRNLVP